MGKWMMGLILLSFSSFSGANYYERGNWTCSDFERGKQYYEWDPEDLDNIAAYGICSVLKRERENDDLSLLYNAVERHGHVYSAFFIAEYVTSGGQLGNEIVPDNLNRAIEAHHKVVALIRLDPSYPYNGNRIYEVDLQMELNSIFFPVYLYFDKYKYGALGTYRQARLQSPSYEGDKNLSLYPEYSPYTVDSLEKVIIFANECLALPLKDYYYPPRFELTRQSCQILKEGAEELLPIERERLTVLRPEVCPDILNCPKQDELADKVVDIVNSKRNEVEGLFQAYKQTHDR